MKYPSRGQSCDAMMFAPASGASMRRRDFIRFLLIGTGAWSSISRAATGPYRIGYLSITSTVYDAPNLAAFRKELQRLGYVEGRNLGSHYRASNGDAKLLTVLAQEIADLKPNVVLATAVSPTRVMSRIAPKMPIVCPAFSDAFVPDLATSFAHPGGNVTGVASDVESLIGKLGELALDAIPMATKVGFLKNPAGGSMPRLERQVRAAAKEHGIPVFVASAESAEQVPTALQQLSDQKVDVVIVPANGLFNAGQKGIADLGLKLRLPLIFSGREGVVSGGLASYGISTRENYRRAADYVDKIFKGATAGTLPIEFPTKVELVVNMKTAKLLGVKIPATLLDRADEVIE
jgi:ABC-type uncharacterized transport system substrate-binding protein